MPSINLLFSSGAKLRLNILRTLIRYFYYKLLMNYYSVHLPFYYRSNNVYVLIDSIAVIGNSPINIIISTKTELSSNIRIYLSVFIILPAYFYNVIIKWRKEL